ncbi:MAG: hypothetical protein ACOX6I_06140 [Syntrophomonadaceae bacterium]|jgi:hypothetical protein
MQNLQGKVISKDKFLEYGTYAKEEYEGLIVGSDVERGYYNIGIQLDEDKILVVDRARDKDVHQRLEQWVPKIQEIQREHGVNNDLQNYTR